MLALVVAVAIVVGLAGLDRAIARTVKPSSALAALVSTLELITFKRWSDFLLPLVLICGGATASVLGRARAGRPILYVGAVQLSAYLVADLSKPHFGRLRPFEAIGRGAADVWFAGANSFPSGHVAYFAGLAVPIVMLFPRAWPLLAIPLLVAAERILSADHYLSDASAGFALALLAAWLLRPIAGSRDHGKQS